LLLLKSIAFSNIRALSTASSHVGIDSIRDGTSFDRYARDSNSFRLIEQEAGKSRMRKNTTKLRIVVIMLPAVHPASNLEDFNP